MSESKKVIEIEKSSLLSLKAEVLKLKKQTEELKNKEHKPVKINKKSVNNLDNRKIIDSDEINELARSKRILEAKAKYYERMSKSKINSTLVLFEKKNEAVNTDEREDFIEITDCFGRTRKVEKSDYDKIKQQNNEIVQEPQNTVQPVIEEEIGDNFLKQKEEWRKQEEINKERNEVYYQDILFDEARLHGTAWYKFSLDHEERKIQQENLIKMREKTEQAQSQRAELKKHRDDIIKNRIKLAKERMRIKLGLPIEQTDNENDKIPDDNNMDERHEAAKEQVEKDAEKELQRERERKRHIRPWDKDKQLNKQYSDESDDEKWMPKKEKMVMSQDEWIERQRIKRVNEFAPIYDQPSTSKVNKNNYSVNLEQSVAANLRYIREKFDEKK